jgi:hypothetical protein
VKYPVVVSGSHAEELKEAEGERINFEISAATLDQLISRVDAR